MDINSYDVRRYIVMLIAILSLGVVPIIWHAHDVTEPLYVCLITLDCGAVMVSVFFSSVLLLDRFYDNRNRSFVEILLCIGFTSYADALGLLSWKLFGGGTPTFLLLSSEYVLMSLTLVVLVRSVSTFLLPRSDSLRRYLIISNVLFAAQAILILQNLFTHNVWHMDGDSLVHDSNYLLIFLIPVLQNILYIVACIRTSTHRSRGWGFALLMVISLAVIACMLPKYYSTIHFLSVLYPVLLILPYMYNISNVQLEEGSKAIKSKKSAMVIAEIDREFLSSVIETIGELDYVSDEVSDALEKLRHYLLDNIEYIGSSPVIPLEKELDNVSAFIYLEKLRFKNRLNIEYDLHELDASVPPLCMQILVENAVKHGISKRPEGGTVRIQTEKRVNQLAIVVSDDGVGFDVNAPRPNVGRRHVGVDNLKARIESEGGSMVIESTPGVGTTATIIVPFKE